MRNDFDFDDAFRSDVRAVTCGCAGVALILIGAGYAMARWL